MSKTNEEGFKSDERSSVSLDRSYELDDRVTSQEVVDRKRSSKLIKNHSNLDQRKANLESKMSS